MDINLPDILDRDKVQQLIRNCTWSQIPQAKEAADDIRILFFAGYMSQSAPAQHPEGQDEVGRWRGSHGAARLLGSE